MTKAKIQLISKYILLMIVFYLLEYILNYFIDDLLPMDDQIEFIFTSSMVNLGFTFILNLITVIIITKDTIRLKVQTKYVTLATIIFRPLGVYSFLTYYLYANKEEKIDVSETINDVNA